MHKLLLLISLFALSAHAQVTKVTDFGAIPDDGLNDDAAVTAARKSMMNKGGTLEFPCGTLDLRDTQVFISNFVSWRIEGNMCAVIRVSPNYTLFEFGNSPHVIISGMAFLGIPENTIDSALAVVVFGGGQNIVRDSKFLGLRSGNSIIVTGQDTLIENSQFDGNSSPNGIYSVGEYQKGLTIKKSTFIDYANFQGQYLSKTPYGNDSWITVSGGPPLNQYKGQRQLRVEDCIFDEGAQTHIYASDIFAVDISGLRSNVSGVDGGKSIYLSNVSKARIAASWFGLSGYARPAVVAVNGSRAFVEDISLGSKVYHANHDKSSKMFFDSRFCEGCKSTLMP